ncbi:MAG TPA: formate dehydrogenase-N subunit alpha, partial [Desulfobacteraceae bacterium]|nr:formate dehydrogenase-N subunit alpha [Desulfobacteraceae bacterium]
HPLSFKYVLEAQQKGASLISVDPRFTRTSSKADLYAPLRSGTDIAVLGGMIKYILDNELFNEEYVVEYTNASFLVNKDFDFDDGKFSGLDPETKTYNRSTWGFQMDKNGVPKRDNTLRDRNSVFHLLKKHYKQYDTKTVSSITGMPEEDLLALYRTYAATGARGKAGTIMYAMGWTQHTVGVQNIRCMAMIQLLLGNMGVAGGGVNALRGESNVQGSTDHCLLWHIWPGYLKTPRASNGDLAAYNSTWTPESSDPLSANWWQHTPKYTTSLLKSFFGEQATKTNDFGYSWLPKVDDKTVYSWFDLFDEMYRGSIEGFFAWGQNPACSGANAAKNREAMKNLDWMVNVNLFDNETGSFWKGPGMDPTTIKTEVFMLPACVSVEKEGSITNSGRWMQWRYQGPKPLGNSLSDGDIIMRLGHELKKVYASSGAFPDPIKNLKWDYETHGEYDPHKMAKEINGYFTKDVMVKGKFCKKGTLVPSFAWLQDDGSTSSANWLYCNSYTEKGNMSARRSKKDAKNKIGLYPEFSWCWPVNRRIIYNRASVDPKGQPWDKEDWVIRFEGDTKDGKYVSKKWAGDVPDGGWYPLENPDGTRRSDAKHAFIMRKHGFAQIYGPGKADGPFPSHYEPIETPVSENLLYPDQLSSPVAVTYDTDIDKYAASDSKYTIVCSTYRVTEHWQTGLMTRPQPWLMELQPQVFVEMSEELAKEKGIQNGERVMVESIRADLECTAIVTKRFKPFDINGKTVHQVGVPWHFGWRWPDSSKNPSVKEDSANLLTPSAGDPNTRIPETKAFLVNIAKL